MTHVRNIHRTCMLRVSKRTSFMQVTCTYTYIIYACYMYVYVHMHVTCTVQTCMHTHACHMCAHAHHFTPVGTTNAKMHTHTPYFGFRTVKNAASLENYLSACFTPSLTKWDRSVKRELTHVFSRFQIF